MKNKRIQDTIKNSSTLRLVGVGGYAAIIILACAILIADPTGLDVRSTVVPFVIVLFAVSLLLGYSVVAKSASKVMVVAGTIAMAVLATFVGVFMVACVAWLVALTHV